ncbi:ureidoglycolate lyase [Aliiroseovarius subalbicans]|uniref:ureidoglycolate lyase n=1 Tax=Aliiroseovarius subalbicans TaxID=2925840 RepID=UPI001F57C937|nr:ureidoglycolate lyase [Aliiroseovarius subalbicans]MCI2400251.1 ureidoglycolate lyase [Aliiroseovarius subalbicans]
MRVLTPQPLTAQAFAPYGDVIEAAGDPDRIINEGLCGRYHDLAQLDFAGGRVGISMFNAEPRALPYAFSLVERHPEGSQAFVPLTPAPFLVIVAPDTGGTPGTPVAFLTAPGQAINFHRGTWHGVLTPLAAPGLFAVVDRIGPGDNLEEYRFEEDFIVDPA